MTERLSPKEIWLQWPGEDEHRDPEAITWAEDEVGDHDVKYVRVDILDAVRQERDDFERKFDHEFKSVTEVLNQKRLLTLQLETARKALEQVAQSPSEIYGNANRVVAQQALDSISKVE